MAICDSKLYFSRDVKVLIEIGAEIWEIPVLDGFSFAQANNSSEIVLAEMENTSGVSRRGKRMFNDSLAPAEWSFTTYTRPFKSAAGAPPLADTVANVHAVEEVLWALMAGKAERSGKGWASGGTDYFTLGLTDSTIDFNTSNTSSLGTAAIYFVLESTGLTYKITDAAVNEVTVNFDIDGIAQLEWSGMGSEIVEEPSVKTATITEGVTDTDNFIRNRLTQLSVEPVKNPIAAAATTPVSSGAWTVESVTITDPGSGLTDVTSATYFIPGGNGDAEVTYTISGGAVTSISITSAGSGYTDSEDDIQFPTFGNYTPTQEGLIADSYDLTLTGGSITISNNLTYITPEELGIVNIPIGHVTGTRSVSGTFTNYLVRDPNNALSNDSSGFWTDMKALRDVVTHSVKLGFNVGGNTAAAGSPTLAFNMPYCHIEIPTHNIEDVIALETSFSALGRCISSADEITVTYAAV